MKINPDKVKFKTIIHGALDYKFNPGARYSTVPKKVSLPKSHRKNLKPFIGFEQRFPFYRKFQAYTPLCF